MSARPSEGRLVSVRDLPFVVLALSAGLVLVYLGRSLTFWYDEWRWIAFDGDILDALRPVNDHWSTFPLLLYRATFELVELRSYLPYLAEVVVLHLVAVAGAYLLMRRRVGPLAATALSLPLLLLGAGAENLFHAFQTAYLGSVAFGIWAMVCIERASRRSVIGGSTLLVASLTSSGLGMFFVVAVAGMTLSDRNRRSRVVVVVPPAITYVLWLAVFGGEGTATPGGFADPAAVIGFALRGIGYSVAAMAGLERLPLAHLVGIGGFVLICSVVVAHAARRQIPVLAISCLLGVASMYAGIGLARADLEPDYTTRSRYVYVAGFFLVLCVADLLASGVGETMRAKLDRTMKAHVALALALVWVVAANINSLLNTRTQFQYQADLTRAIIELAIEHEGEPWLDPNAGLDLMPPAGQIPGVVAQHGSPLEDAYFPSVATTPSGRAYADARKYLTAEPGSR